MSMVRTRCQMNHRLRASTVQKTPILVLWSVFLSPCIHCNIGTKKSEEFNPFFIFIQLNNTLGANDRRPISLHHSAEKGKHYITHNWKHLSRTLRVQSYSFDISKFTNNGPLLNHLNHQSTMYYLSFLLLPLTVSRWIMKAKVKGRGGVSLWNLVVMSNLLSLPC